MSAPTDRSPPSPSVAEMMAREAFEGIKRAAGKALFRGIAGAMDSLSEDGEGLLEIAEKAAAKTQERIAAARAQRHRKDPPR